MDGVLRDSHRPGMTAEEKVIYILHRSFHETPNDRAMEHIAQTIVGAIREHGPITDDTEWEYGMSEVLVDGSTAFGYPAPTRVEAEARVEQMRRNYPWPEEIGLARRRKAGPWEPVEVQS